MYNIFMEKINYQIKSSAKARYLRIAVYPDGHVVVTKPIRTSMLAMTAFVRSKSRWITQKVNFYQNRKVISLPSPTVDKKDALDFVVSRVNHYNQHYQFTIGKISIKNHKSLWGSCSGRKNLNFNHRIVDLPLYQADYIIVHELCHLKEFNHSRNFWHLVAETMPNYKGIRNELKTYSFY